MGASEDLEAFVVSERKGRNAKVENKHRFHTSPFEIVSSLPTTCA